MSTTQTQHNGVSGIEYQDKVIAPNGRVYAVRDRYKDGYDTLRVKLRHDPRRQMYVPLTRLNQMVREGDWSYVPTNE